MTSRPETTPASGETDVPAPVAAAPQEPSAAPVVPGDGPAPDADSAAPPSPGVEPGDGAREDAPASAAGSPDDVGGAEPIAPRGEDEAPAGATAVPVVAEQAAAPGVSEDATGAPTVEAGAPAPAAVDAAVDVEPAAVAAPGPAVEAPAEQPVPAPEAEPQAVPEVSPEVPPEVSPEAAPEVSPGAEHEAEHEAAAAVAASPQRATGSVAQPPVAQPPVAEPPASLLPGHPDEAGPAPRAVARGRLSHAMRPRATRAQLLAGLLCALLGFALVVQARQTQTQGLEQLRQADLVRLLDNVTNAEARAEQDLRNEQAIRDQLLSGSGSSEAAQQAAQQRLDTLGLLAGTVPATGPGIVLEISDPRRQVDSTVLLDTLEELRDGGAEVIQIGDVRVVAATAFVDDAEGVRVDGRLQTPPYRYSVIGEPQTLAKVLQIPGGVLDVLRSKGAQGRVTQPETIRIDALRPPSRPQYARPAPGGTP